MGVLGTERADKIAKEAVKRSTVQRGIQLLMSEGKSIVLKKANEQWQRNWEVEVMGRHLYSIQMTHQVEGRISGKSRL